MIIDLTINNKQLQLSVEKDELLLDTLRKSGMLSLRRGCDTSNCGICTVWLDMKPVLSCSILTLRVQGRSITTIEGVEADAQEFVYFLSREGADQCGYCSPGFIMTVLAMKNELENPSKEAINHYLAGNLCRCTGYQGQLRAITKYMGVSDL